MTGHWRAVKAGLGGPGCGASTRRAAAVLTALGAVGCGAADEDMGAGELGTAQAEAVVCADGETVEGIDVSHWQSVIDWNAVATTEVAFAITRTNHGSVMDEQFDANWPAIRQVGLLRGAYQYFNAGDDPAEQAATFIEKVGELGPGDLPGVIDIEEADGQPPATIAANVGTWMDLVEAGTGRRPMIYTGSYFWNDFVDADEFADDLLWIAHYTQNCPNLPNTWTDWTIWQYTSSGSVAGITGNVDRNEFNGSLLLLHDLAADGYRAEIESLSYPETMAAGESALAELVVINRGARTWTDQIVLGTTAPRDRASPFAASDWLSDSRVVQVSGEVARGQSYTFEIDLQAPSEPGEYVEHFNLLAEGTAWFSDTPPGGGPGDEAVAMTITVGPSSGGSGGSGGAAGSGGSGGGPGGNGDLEFAGIPNTGRGSSCTVSPRALELPRGLGSGALLALALGALAGRRRRVSM